MQLFLVMTSVIVLAYGQNISHSSVAPTSSALPTTSIPAVTTVTEPTTAKVTTIPPTTTSRTTEPPTTSTEPATTEPVTTEPPPTTTEPPVTTTVAPEPQSATWYVNDTNTNTSCIIAQMAIQLSIPYQDVNKIEHAVFDVPVNGSIHASGSCHNDSQTLVLTWEPSGIQTDHNDTLTLNFEKNATTKDFEIISVELHVVPDDHFLVKNLTEMQFTNEKPLFKTPLNMSYRCAKQQSIELVSKDNQTALLKISKVQLEAFHSGNTTNFSSAQDCQPLDSPDIVPIAVGCALAGLVIIVLIAYLVGRRRSHSRGYLSM